MGLQLLSWSRPEDAEGHRTGGEGAKATAPEEGWQQSLGERSWHILPWYMPSKEARVWGNPEGPQAGPGDYGRQSVIH